MIVDAHYAGQTAQRFSRERRHLRRFHIHRDHSRRHQLGIAGFHR